VGVAAAGQPVGSRSGLVGMAVQMLRDLLAACSRLEENKGQPNKRLTELLQVGPPLAAREGGGARSCRPPPSPPSYRHARIC
jgi:hypothetical protein